jgi:nudix-type nucleoside diphosphatase (YffH/AdpP family)
VSESSRGHGADRPSRVEVLQRERLVEAYFKMDRVLVRRERFDGTMDTERWRLVFERGDAAGVLLYHQETWDVLLVRQFRYPAYARGDDGWLWELVAGTQAPDDDPAETARREAMEEAGYRLGELQRVGMVYPSPGACTERIHLFVAPVRPDDRVADGGGLAGEGEDIATSWMPLDNALDMAQRGEIVHAPTLLCLQHLQLMRDVP